MELIEGVGNEVTGAFLLLSGIIGVCVYKLVSQWSNTVTYQEQSPQYPSPTDETATPTTPTAGPGPATSESLLDMGRRGSYDEPRQGSLEIRVMYRESHRTVYFPSDKSLLDLKRYCFSRVLDEGQRIHMVYQGHLLRPDTASLATFDLECPATLTCQISHSTNTNSVNNQTTSDVTAQELDISGLLLPLLGLMLFCCWMAAMSLSSAVSPTLYFALLFLSACYVLVLVNSIT